jgi:hypothetical protein
MKHDIVAWINLRGSMKEKTKISLASISPYTINNVDAAIAHLEQVLCAECADSVFGQSYWRARVLQFSRTSGLLQAQWKRLQHMLELLSDVSTPAP